MRRLLGRLIALAPTDTWFFLSLSTFGAILTLVYWYWTYDWAGTVLLFGFSVATGVNAGRLLLGHPPRRSSAETRSEEQSRRRAVEHEPAVEHEHAGEQPAAEAPAVGQAAAPVRAGSLPVATRPVRSIEDADSPGEPRTSPVADPDRPFLDETGRVPAPSIAPVALALAAALIVTSLVLGPWLLVIAVLPLGWGASSWLRDAGAEFRAQEGEELPGAAPGPGLPDAPSGTGGEAPAGAGHPSSGPATGPAAFTGPASFAGPATPGPDTMSWSDLSGGPWTRA
jgi:hypothetical protein